MRAATIEEKMQEIESVPGWMCGPRMAEWQALYREWIMVISDVIFMSQVSDPNDFSYGIEGPADEPIIVEGKR